jgi:hypothetical protein
MFDIRPVWRNVFVDGSHIARERAEIIFEQPDKEENAEVYGLYEGEPGNYEWLCDCRDRETAEAIAKALASRGGVSIK